MKKNLITSALLSCAALTSFNALASGPEFYGRADLSVTYADNGFGAHTNTAGTTIENNSSWLGVNGTETISDQLEILYRMEFGVNNYDNSGNTFSARNTYIGLKSEAGTVLVGRNDTVFKAAEGGIDVFGNTNSDIDRLVAGQDREADGVTYYSPKIADLVTLNATYLVDDNHDDRVNSSSMYSISATAGDKALKVQPYYVAAAYQEGIKDVKAFRAVGQAKFGDVILGALYQNSESQDPSRAHLEGDSFFISAAYVMGDLKLKAMYGQDDSGLGKFASNFIGDVDGGLEQMSDFELQQFSIGADYRVSKNAMLFGHYTKFDGDMTVATIKHDMSDDIFTVGLRLDF